MVAACGAETRIASKYAAFVEDTKRDLQKMSPLVALQLGLIVRYHLPPRVVQANILKFFGLYSSFGLAFWYGIKSFLEGQVENVGEIMV